MVKNHRAILRSHIRSLSVQGCGIMVRPENIQKFAVTDLRRIEFHFHHLSMPSLIGANIFIRRILLCPACVPDSCGQNALQITKSFVHSPETACAERGFLCLHTEMMMRLLAARNQALVAIRLIEFLSSAKGAISNQPGALPQALTLTFSTSLLDFWPGVSFP